MRADSLNEKLIHRPSPADLIKEGILVEDPTELSTSPSDEPSYEEKIEDEYAKREGGA
jgi:hypothetical protein